MLLGSHQRYMHAVISMKEVYMGKRGPLPFSVVSTATAHLAFSSG